MDDDEYTPATEAQKVYLHELSNQAGEPAPGDDISREEAEEKIRFFEQRGLGEEALDIANDSDTTERFNTP